MNQISRFDSIGFDNAINTAKHDWHPEACTWMSSVPCDTSIAEMTIPGTHDSGTGHAIVGANTQHLDIWNQLIRGTRFLDIRCNHDGNVFKVWHGSAFGGADCHLSFEQVLNWCQQACYGRVSF